MSNSFENARIYVLYRKFRLCIVKTIIFMSFGLEPKYMYSRKYKHGYSLCIIQILKSIDRMNDSIELTHKMGTVMDYP